MNLKTPYRGLLPPNSKDEVAALIADIRMDGVRDPIIIDEEGNILDGHNRYEIAKEAPTRVVAGLTEPEKKAFVIRSNDCRRNLSFDQRRELLTTKKAIAAELRKEGKTQAQVADLLAVARETVRDWEENATNGGNANSCVPDVRSKVAPKEHAKIVERLKHGETQEQIAADYKITRQGIAKIAKKVEKKTETESKRKAAAKKVVGTDNVRLGDFRKVLDDVPDASCELIFTDPPYDRKSLPLYDDLAALASRVLIDGGSLITYLGSLFVPEVIRSLTTELRFFWPLCVWHTGKSLQMREYGIRNKWKPLLWFVKGNFRIDREEMLDDGIESRMEKDQHPWQQSLVEARYYIGRLTKRGAVVIDPFCGGGTTAFAAQELGRQYITCDKDRDAVAKTIERLSK